MQYRVTLVTYPAAISGITYADSRVFVFEADSPARAVTRGIEAAMREGRRVCAVNRLERQVRGVADQYEDIR